MVRTASAHVPARGGAPHRGQAGAARTSAASPCSANGAPIPASCSTLPAAAFTPRPKVDFLLLVEFVPKDAPQPACDVAALERVTAAAFGQRRKMLRSSLRQITPDAEELLQGLGIDPKRRAEELQIGDFCRIANALAR